MKLFLHCKNYKLGEPQLIKVQTSTNRMVSSATAKSINSVNQNVKQRAKNNHESTNLQVSYSIIFKVHDLHNKIYFTFVII